MGFSTIIGNFIKGLRSAIFQAGTLKEVLSSAISDGVEGGINRSMPILIKTIVLGSIFLTGIFLFGLGISKWTESLFATPGLGFILTGLVLFAAGSLYLAINSKAM